MQQESYELAKKNIQYNKLEERFQVIQGNIKEIKQLLPRESMDVVVSNPPYFLTSNFQMNEVKRIAKEEKCLKLNELIDCASGMLKFGGRFYIVYKAERLAELIIACERKSLTLKKMFFTENGKGAVNLVVAEFHKGGKSGVKVLPNLITNKSDGEFLEELKTRKFLG